MDEIYVPFRRYEDGDAHYEDLSEKTFNAGRGGFCPTYVNRTAPCQAHCPSGHDVRTWMGIVARRVKPAQGQAWQEYAFLHMAEANPFPATMGLTCSAPCEKKCNREDVDGHVGINAIEHAMGMWALAHNVALPKPQAETGKTVAVAGGGVAGLSCAYQLRRLGHKVVIFEAGKLGGVMTGADFPQEIVAQEIQRILDMGGIEVRASTEPGGELSAVYWSERMDAPKAVGQFAAEKIANGDLPTAQVGKGWRAARDIDAYLRGAPMPERPRFDVHNYGLIEDLKAHGRQIPSVSGPVRATETAEFAVHNYEDRHRDRLVATRDLFLGHFKQTPRIERPQAVPGELAAPLADAEAIKESRRCMSCGMCFECSVCIQYCPVGAVERAKPTERAYGRFVETDYAKCVQCQICKDVCPTGYIQMGLER